MDCDKYLELMSAALDGELTADERRELDSHLAVCPECTELFNTLSDNTKAMRELDCEVPAGLKQRIMSSLPEQEKPDEKIKPVRWMPKTGSVIHWKRWAPVAAAACLALVIALVPRSGMSTNESAAPNAADAPRSPGASPMPSSVMESYIASGSGSCAPDSPGTSDSQMGGLADPSEPIAAESAPDGNAYGEGEAAEPGHYRFENQRSIRVGYGAAPAPGARIIGSAEALKNYLAQFGTTAFDGGGNPIPIAELEELQKACTEDFFRTHRLLCVVVEASSGSYRYEIASQGLYRDSVTVLEYVPEAGTCDMAAWLLVAEVDTMFDDSDTLEVLVHRIYK